MANAPPYNMVEAVDVSNAILWLVRDECPLTFTGVTLPVERRLHQQEVTPTERKRERWQDE